MTKAATDGELDTVVGVAAVERRVKTQVSHLHNVAHLLREFFLAHDKYAQDYTRLPCTPPNTLGTCPQLQRIAHALEQILAAVTQAHATLAKELGSTVVVPLEAFEKQQRHQTKQLLNEIEEAVQNERRVHTSLVRLFENASVSGDAENPAEDNQACEGVTHQDECLADAKAIKATRERARQVVRQRLAELELTREQQIAVLHGQLRRCIDAITRRTNRVFADVTEALSSLALSTLSQRQEEDSHGTLEDALQSGSLHIEVTTWMVTVFSQIVSIEESMLKRLQTLPKTHSLRTIQTVFSPSVCCSLDNDSSSSTLSVLIQNHKQLTATLADPIGRTLRLSKQKQATIQNELTESMQELQKRVQTARAYVKDKEARLVEFLQHEDFQYQQQREPESTGTETMRSPFGLRHAVASWTKQLTSPHKPLFKSHSVSSLGVFRSKQPALSPTKLSVIRSPGRVNLENELVAAQERVQKLEENELVQRTEMVKTLEQTAFVGSKTMEIMVSDYFKNVMKAMSLLATATAKCSERLEDTAEETKTSGFQSIKLFDDRDLSEYELMKRLGDGDKSLKPETHAESQEAEDAVEAPIKSRTLVKLLVPVKSSPTCALQTETTLNERLRIVVTELSKFLDQIQASETPQKIWSFANAAVVATWKGLEIFLQRVVRYPVHWHALLIVAIMLGLFGIVNRLDRLNNRWYELVESQRENTRGLQQLVDLIGE